MWHMQNFAVWQAISILQAVVMHEEHLHKTKLYAAYYYQRKIFWKVVPRFSKEGTRKYIPGMS